MNYTSWDLTMATVKELQAQAKQRKIKGYSKMSKSQLLSALGQQEDARHEKSAANLKKRVSNAAKYIGAPDEATQKRILSNVKKDVAAAKKANPNLTQAQLRKVASDSLNKNTVNKKGKFAPKEQPKEQPKAGGLVLASGRLATRSKPESESRSENKREGGSESGEKHYGVDYDKKGRPIQPKFTAKHPGEAPKRKAKESDAQYEARKNQWRSKMEEYSNAAEEYSKKREAYDRVVDARAKQSSLKDDKYTKTESGQNIFELLKVKPTDSHEKAKANYQKLIRKYHPDHYQGKDATEKTRELIEAWEVWRKRQAILELGEMARKVKTARSA